ncbi:CBU_0592 family membrane protein [Parvularcula oceani]|uniref:CBU_0592 family membrane protein n=1 Tax=Parvularcula oceani TaxID=1247963 RepID=UPI0004E1C6F2
MLDLIGWAGTLLYLVNHGLLSRAGGAADRRYYVLNLIAAAALTFTSAIEASWQAVGTNAFWTVLSLYGILGLDDGPALPLRPKWLLPPLAALGAAGIAAAPFAPLLGAEALGWAGTLTFSLSYLLFSAGRIVRRDFLGLNALAALALIPILAIDGNWPVFGLEVAWFVLSVWGWRSVRGVAASPPQPARGADRSPGA